MNKARKSIELRPATELPQWVCDLQDKAKTYISNNNMPNRKSENWRYSDLSLLENHDFHILNEMKSNPAIFYKNFYSSKREVSIPIINGKFDSHLFSNQEIPNGLIVKELKDAFWNNKDELLDLIDKFPTKDNDYFNQLNQSFLSNGVYIEIKEHCEITPIIHIKHLFTSGQAPFAAYPRLYINIKKGGQGKILETKVANKDSCYFTNSSSFIALESAAKLHHYQLDDLSCQSFHINSQYYNIEDQGEIINLTLSKGAKLYRSNYDINLLGKDSSASLESIAILNKIRHLDNFSRISHNNKNSKSIQRFKSILFDNAKYAFEGSIKVDQKASDTKALQINKNLLIGENAEVNVKPWLQIDNDNVECSHGSSTGQCDHEQIFYLMSRGLSYNQAQSLICKGFLKDIATKLIVPELDIYFNTSIDKTLSSIMKR